MIRCPQCACEIEHLNWTEASDTYGTCRIHLNNGMIEIREYDTDGVRENNTIDHMCPECGAAIALNSLIIESADTEERTLPVADTPNISPIRSNRDIDSKKLDTTLLSLGFYCPHCNTFLPVNLTEEKETECIQCQTIITLRSLLKHA